MRIDETIVPGLSLGGIKLGENVERYLAKLSENHVIFDDKSTSWALVDDGLISIAYDSDGSIQTICANSRYPGNYAGLIWPGMTVLQVIQNTHTQVSWAGRIMVNGIRGIGLAVPEGYDDFERMSDTVPDDIVLEYLCVFQDHKQEKKKGKKKR